MVDCRSAQAVGQAVGRNPIALIIPCHRLIAANGQLGGYAYGTEIKKQLLELEQL
jgi:methylated-DNA-[protein]-cysteine S-methyltransferase